MILARMYKTQFCTHKLKMKMSLLGIAVEITTQLSGADTYTSLHTPTWLISALLGAAVSVNGSEPRIVHSTQALMHSVYLHVPITCVSLAIIPSGLVFLWRSTIIVLVLLADNSCWLL